MIAAVNTTSLSAGREDARTPRRSLWITVTRLGSLWTEIWPIAEWME
jgi:hypothetical protein